MFNNPYPINIASWAIGAIVVAFISWRLWVNYRVTGNYLSKLFSIFDLTLSASFSAYAFIPIFTLDENILLGGYIISDLIIYIAYLVQLKILWFIALKNYFNFWYVLVPAVIISAIAWFAEVKYATVSVGYPITVYTYPDTARWVQVGLLATIIIPAGFVFLWQAVKEIRTHKPVPAFVKSLALGLAYVLVGGMVILQNIYGEPETVGSSQFNMVVFLLLFVAVLIPQFKKSKT